MEKKSNLQKKLLSDKEAAEVLNVPDYFVARSIRKGKLKGYKQYNQYYVFSDDLEEFIKSDS